MILRPSTREPGTTYVKGTPSVVGDRPEGNPLGVAAMVVGLCGIALYWLPWVNLICPAGSIIIGSLSLHQASKGTTTSNLPAVAGLLLGCLLFPIGLFVIEVALSLTAVPGQPGEASAMSAASGGVRNAKEIAEKSLTVPAAARDWSNGGEDPMLSTFSMNRLEKILQLQRQATYPLDPVASVRARPNWHMSRFPG